MKIKKIIAVVLSVIMILSVLPIQCFATTEGTTYYVDSFSGNDANSGTSPENAWQTLIHASNRIYSAGDKILLKNGSYFIGGFHAKGDGTEENPITLATYGEGAKPIITNAPTDPEYHVVLCFADVAHWVAKGLEITAPEGTGLFIYAENDMVEDITVEDCVLHNIQNHPSDTYLASQRAAIRIMSNTASAYNYASGIHINNCEIYDCGYGVFLGGHFDAENPNSEEHPYNKDILIENCSLNNLYDDAFIIAQTERFTLRNTSILNACQSSGIYYTAPTWTWGVTEALIENCEIAGAKNILDGMAVDFDDHSANSMYQYIYSHDNTRFMWNCPYASDDHYNNTVRYCLSVNDNLGDNCGGKYTDAPEHNFNFYNNTIVNGSNYNFYCYENSNIKNNIFSLVPGYEINFSDEYKNNISDNCYYGVLPHKYDENPIHANPQFAGTDYTDPNSFILKSCSPCINAGVQVEEDMGEHDFYGNPLTDKHNIGCYEGDGVEGEYEKLSLSTALGRIFEGFKKAIKEQAIHDINWVIKQFNKAIDALKELIEKITVL